MKNGIEQTQKEMIQTMYGEGMGEKEIARITHIPLEKVEEILKKKKGS